MLFSPSDILLRKIPSQKWSDDYLELLNTPFISKKYNRHNRLQSKYNYIASYLSDIFYGGGNCLDIGCGPGEYLEVCRHFGNKISGIDAELGQCDMGDEYLRLSILMTDRQNIPVQYVGFQNLLKNKKLPYDDNSLTSINSQGSIEMVFGEFMLGEALALHRDTAQIEWNITQELIDLFSIMISEFHRILVKNGSVLIFGNTCKNQDGYNKMFLDIIKKFNFRLEYTKDNRLHKIRKL